MPASVTTAATVSPGVQRVKTFFTMEGVLPRMMGMVTMEMAAPPATSGPPPRPPIISPEEPVRMFTLKSVSTSKAPRTPKSSRFRKPPLE